MPDKINKLINGQNLLSNISCFHLNCHSFSTKTDMLQAFISSIGFKFDIISFYKIRLSNNNASLFLNTFPSCKFLLK